VKNTLTSLAVKARAKNEERKLPFMKSAYRILRVLLLLTLALLLSSRGVGAKGGGEVRTSHKAKSRGTPVVLDLENIQRTPERLDRGKYLVEGLLQCTSCHSQMDFAHRPAQPIAGTIGGGRVFGRGSRPEGTSIVAPNISSDPEYGAGNWPDRDLVRALRQGIGHDGRTLFPLMPYEYFRNLSDEDLASVIVYVRSFAPVHVPQPKTVLPESLAKAIHPLAPVEHVPEPDKSDRTHYGKYLVTGGHCKACHTPHDENGDLISGLEFSGGQVFTGPYGPNGSIAKVASLNLTWDASGISYLDEAKFIEALKTGSVTARPLATAMPWSYFRNLTVDDLKAIFAYLHTLTPVTHRVDNTEPPTYCRLCRHIHGLGDKN
jgi:hypothetical protein